MYRNRWVFLSSLGFALALLVPGSALAQGSPKNYTAQELKALHELSNDLAAFKRGAADYRLTVNRIVKRAYQARRKKLIGGFDKKVRASEAQERTRRVAAITLFEDFLRRYPNDSRWTPDVIFRLAELYFEKSNDEYLLATEGYERELSKFERKEIATAPIPPKQDYHQTIELHRKLIEEFPSYRLIDGAYYLLGFCLTEMAKEEAGKKAFLSLVCRNKHKPPLTDAAVDAAEKASPVSTAASLNLSAYDECRALRPKSRFNSEAWVRIGEYHFDENQLGEAIAAYKKVLEMGPQENPYFDEALYKLAWTYYRADRFKEAIAQFDRLVVFADKEYERTGKYGSEMRPESIQYLAISFAEEDWDGDTLPDGESGLSRIEAAYAARTQEKHVYDIYVQLAQIYFDTLKYDQAVEVYKLILKRWPYKSKNPELQDKIILALERQRKFDDAIREREEFTRLFGKGTEWERRNRNNPEALKKAREYDEQALIQAAVFHHKAGQDLKKRGLAMADGALLQRAAAEYALAAQAYSKYLERFPRTKNSYEIRYSYASCLFYSEKFEEAAVAFAEVRDSNLDDRYREEAAFSAAKSYEELIKREVAANKIQSPGLPDAKTPPAEIAAVPVPRAFQLWQKALDEYVAKLPDSAKTPQISYNAADISQRFRQFPDARKRYAAIYKQHCKTPMAVNAAQAILVSFQLEKNLDQMEVWATKLSKGECGKASGKVIAGTTALLSGIKFKRARQLQAKGDELRTAGNHRAAAPYYDKAASAYLALVDSNPQAADAAAALNNAAVCFEHSRRFESATKLYERLWQNYKDSPLAPDALWRAAVNYERFFQFNKAVQNYLIMADSPRFVSSSHRSTAIFNAARLLENDQAYGRAAGLFLRYAKVAKKPEDAAAAYFQAGLIYGKMNDFGGMVRIFGSFPRNYGSVPGQSARAIEGVYRLARAAQKRNDARSAYRYYKEAISLFSTSGQPAGSDSAEYAAQAAFELAEEKLRGYLKRQIQGSLAVVDRKRKSMEQEAVALKAEYERIWSYKRARWTLAAMYRSGTVMEHYAKSVAKGFREAPIPKKVKRLGADAVDLYMEQVNLKLDEVVRPLEESARKLYDSCVQKAASFGVSNEYTEAARARLNAFDPAKYPLLKRAKTEVILD